MTDNVNHPSHYADNGPFECIELTEQFDFCVGNAIKYVWRHNDKGKPVEDLSKALWYLNREANRIDDTDYEAAAQVNPSKPGCMNGILYRQAGNAMPVTVLEEILDKALIHQEKEQQ